MELARRLVRRVRRSFAPSPREALLRKMPKHAVCCEVGVWKGGFSAQILKTTRPAEFHMVDPWAFQPEFPDRWYGGVVARQQRDMDAIYKEILEKYGRMPEVRIHRETSETALARFADGLLDWIYIDGNHAYDYVFKDLELAFLKVRPGGFIAGDDYTWGQADGFPVKRAVADFLAGKRIPTDRLALLGSQFIIER